MGTAAIAAQGMTNIIENLNGIMSIGMGIGLMTVVGECLGAGEKEEAAYYIKKISIAAEVVLIITCLLMFGLTYPITYFGGMEPESAKLCISCSSEPIWWNKSHDPYNWFYDRNACYHEDAKFSTLWLHSSKISDRNVYGLDDSCNYLYSTI